jgi:hypothetical protein
VWPALVAAVPQHPSFHMNLRGRQDLPMARVHAHKTAVLLEHGDSCTLQRSPSQSATNRGDGHVEYSQTPQRLQPTRTTCA